MEPHGQFSPTRALAWTSDFDKLPIISMGKEELCQANVFGTRGHPQTKPTIKPQLIPNLTQKIII